MYTQMYLDFKQLHQICLGENAPDELKYFMIIRNNGTYYLGGIDFQSIKDNQVERIFRREKI